MTDSLAGRTPRINAIGISYMYKGEFVRKPGETDQSKPAFHVGPHIMIVSPNQDELQTYNRDGTGNYVPAVSVRRSGGGRVSNQVIRVNRGSILLKELKDLVDFFPEHHRKEVIKIFRTVFNGLNFSENVFDGEDGKTEQLRNAKTAP